MMMLRAAIASKPARPARSPSLGTEVLTERPVGMPNGRLWTSRTRTEATHARASTGIPNTERFDYSPISS